MLSFLADQATWGSFILTTVNTWLVGDKVWWAPWVGVASCVCGVVTGLHLGQLGITALAGVGLATNLRQAWKWRPKRER